MASLYVESENSESCETDSGSDSEVENGDLANLESQKTGNLKDELEEEDRVGLVPLHPTVYVLHYEIFIVL
jgi:hypothetical protein